MFNEGKKFKPSASMFNELGKMARDYRSGALAANGANRSTIPSYLTCLIKNTTGDTMRVGAPVVISAVTIGSDSEVSAGVDSLGFFNGAFPSTVLTLPGCKICIDVIPAGGFGRVAIGGVMWVKVSGTDVGNYVDTLPSSDGDYKTSWRYSDAGPHRVLGRTTNGAMVAIGESSWNIVAVTPGGGIAAESVGTCTLYRVNPSTAAITSTSFSIPVRNKSKYLIQGSKRVFAQPFGDHFWTDDPVSRVFQDTDDDLKYDTRQTTANLIIESTECE